MLWISPAHFPILRQDEVHLWLAFLPQPSQEIAKFWEILNAKERQRANRLIVKQHRERFVVARGMLRQLLANYLDYSADEIKFTQGAFGKLAIDSSSGNPKCAGDIKFNLSHAGDYALFAFALHRDLGVDIELIRADLAVEEIAQRFFSPVETTELLSLSKEIRAQAFFNCWTRKEAFIKAIGQGLYYPLHEFNVDVKTSGDAQINLNICDQKLQDKKWSLFSLETVSGYTTALVVRGVMAQKKLFKFKVTR